MPESSILLGALVSDAMALMPGTTGIGAMAGAITSVTLDRLLYRRAEKARDILLEELKAGEISLDAQEADEAAAILYRYLRAAQEGMARDNLRILARIIAGQKAGGALRADYFLSYADIIASLRQEEIILLGALQKHGAVSKPDFQEIAKTTRIVMDALIPDVFATEEEFAATSQALTRTGFVGRTIASTYDCQEPCYLTPLFTKISSLVSFIL